MASLLAALLAAAPPGDAEIRGSGIVIRTSARFAGAIHSLTWKGREFVDAVDHGRELQSACSFGTGSPGFVAETFNPTEAGSRWDGDKETTSSVLLDIRAERNVLQTRTRMAYWLRPGETSAGRPARNTTRVSDCIFSKKVTIGVRGMDRVVEYVATFRIPEGRSHPFAQFEAVTGYMPPAFSRFLTVDPATGKTAPLSDGPGEQPLPVVFATPSGSHAMGIWSPEPGPGYGRWNFRTQRVVKWNCVFRKRDAAGEHAFRCYVPVGTLEEVRSAIVKLAAVVRK